MTLQHYETYKVIKIGDGLDYRIKYPYLVLKFAGADVRQRPTYRLVKQERTEGKALAYVQAHMTDQ